ncbi:hypothetical protein GN244_ATG02029 [Phytophthora infestans]|uniref:Uncharacterized protein n=1 Tax=Phytophthora infestans TaxID=4787 RepID=A0A833TLU2_PHYIN|nr:hypothetical protein GN244_ATG02029 [Phytophthora infestans]KAF4127347.1 hypothetical protein GN958_ATG23459 [Phytophthora infestans]KAF4141317.1 hypothetical protein GN958_ATG09488 [Phytophthora infestans]
MKQEIIKMTMKLIERCAYPEKDEIPNQEMNLVSMTIIESLGGVLSIDATALRATMGNSIIAK